MRKTTRWLGSLAAISSFAIGGAQAQSTITMWVHAGPGPEREAYAATIKAFNDSQKEYKAEFVTQAEGAYASHVEEAAKSGKLPCVLDFDGPLVYNYIWTKKIIPLDAYQELQRIKVDLLPSLVSQGTYGNRLYSLGQYDSGLAIWGNRKLLEKAGVRIPTRMRARWKMKEFEEALHKLKDSGVPYPLDMKFNYGIGEWITYGFSPIVQSMGGDLIDRRTFQTAQGAINGPGAVAALAALQNWVKAGYVNAASKVDDDFIKGRSALSYVGHWTYRDYKKALGDDLVLIPMPRFGETSVTGAGSWNFGISADCKDPRGAAKVLAFLMTPQEITRVTAINGAVPGTYTALLQNKDYGDGGPLNVYTEQIFERVAMVRPETPAYPVITEAFSKAVESIVKGADVKAELDKAAQKIDRHIKEKGYAAR